MLDSLLPKHYTQREHDLDLTGAEGIAQFRPAVDEVSRLLDPMRCDAKYLPTLAKFYCVDMWSDAMNELDKRTYIQNTMLLKRRKGSAWATKHALSSIGVETVLEEWFHYAGTPFHFRVSVNVKDRGLDDATIELIEKMVSTHKNERSQLDAIMIYLSNTCSVHYASVSMSGEVTTVYPYFPEPINIIAPQYMGAAYHAVDTTVIYPQGA
jgi:phage tail P2-like protein